MSRVRYPQESTRATGWGTARAGGAPRPRAGRVGKLRWRTRTLILGMLAAAIVGAVTAFVGCALIALRANHVPALHGSLARVPVCDRMRATAASSLATPARNELVLHAPSLQDASRPPMLLELPNPESREIRTDATAAARGFLGGVVAACHE